MEILTNSYSPAKHFVSTIESWGKLGIALEVIGILIGYIIPLFVLLPWTIVRLVQVNKKLKITTLTTDQRNRLEASKKMIVAGLVLAILALVMGVLLGVVSTVLVNKYGEWYQEHQGVGIKNWVPMGGSTVVTGSYLLLPTLFGFIGFILTAVGEGRYRAVEKTLPTTSS